MTRPGTTESDMTNPVQPLDSVSVPDPVTPYDSPSSPSDYASVTPHGIGPAPYNIQAANDEAAVSSALGAAVAIAGAGVLYPRGPRQAETETLIQSAPGFALDGYDIDGGSSGGWPNNVE